MFIVYFLHHWGFLEICYHFSYSHRPIFMILCEMTCVDKGINPQRFRSDPDLNPDLNPD